MKRQSSDLRRWLASIRPEQYAKHLSVTTSISCPI
jgi:hypothetical protein